jgi:uncharacterized protein (DUF2236 family)
VLPALAELSVPRVFDARRPADLPTEANGERGGRLNEVPTITAPVESLRTALAGAVRSRVGGDTADVAIIAAPGPRWFPNEAAIRIVHADAAMFVGGLRALVLQALHPVAMAGVAAHSGYRGDPWGRLQRTSRFLAATTFGPVDVAERVVARVRAVHHAVIGVAPDGQPYRAEDPHLLRWVHVAEVDSFLRAHARFGRRALTPQQRDEYVAEVGFVSAKLGVVDPPQTVAELREVLAGYRPEMRGTPEARDTARFLLLNPPIPLLARPAYGLISAAAVSMLPGWARRMLYLPPPLPIADDVVGRLAGELATRLFRWTLAAP